MTVPAEMASLRAELRARLAIDEWLQRLPEGRAVSWVTTEDGVRLRSVCLRSGAVFTALDYQSLVAAMGIEVRP